MRKTGFSKFTLLLYGAGLVALGIIVLIMGKAVVSALSTIGGIVLIAHGIHLLVNIILRRRSRKLSSVLAAVANLVGGVLIVTLPNATIRTLIIVFAFYVFVNAFVRLMDIIVGRRNGDGNIIYDIIALFFYTIFGVLIVRVPDMGIKSLIVVIGAYCILYGIGQINDFLEQTFRARPLVVGRRLVRFSTPVWLASFLPIRFLRMFEKRQDFFKDNDLFSTEAGYTDVKKSDKEPDLEVLIHIKPYGAGKMGHCDLVVDGRAYSFGNYDRSTSKFFRMYGDGLFFNLDRNAYIRYAIAHDKKIVISYGLSLTAEQKKRVKYEIDVLMRQAYEWKPEFQKRKELDSDAEFTGDMGFCSNLWHCADGKFYKFFSGTFRSYLVLTKNCALILDQILGKAGTDIVRINGIITPGAYFAYMERMLRKSGSMVIRRTIYNLDNTNEYRTSEDYQWEHT